MKIRKGDTVKVISGNDSGKTGEVLRVFTKKSRVVVSGVAVSRRHVKPSSANPDGGLVEFNRPIDVSNVMLMCSKCKQATRIGFETAKGKKLRICKKCGALQ